MANKITQAFILSAGLGTRLRPLTDKVPKVMIPIAPGKPLLEHTIECLKSQGITDFVLNLHFLPEVIISYFGDGRKLGVNIKYSDETGELLETGGAIKKAEALLDDDFLFMYGDELHFFDFRPAIEFYFNKKSLATVIFKKSEHPEHAEIAEIEPVTGKIVNWYTRPHKISELSDNLLANSGLYVFSKRIVDYIPAEVPVKLDGEIIPKILAAGEVLYGVPTDEPIMDVGMPDKYEAAKEFYRRRSSRE